MHVRIGKQKRKNTKQSAYTYVGAIQTPGATRLHASNPGQYGLGNWQKKQLSI